MKDCLEATIWKNALREAMEIWLRRAGGENVETPCPLCAAAEKINGKGITMVQGDNRCRGCPIDELTGKSCCGTPYMIWAKIETSRHPMMQMYATLAAKQEAEMISALQDDDMAKARDCLVDH